MGLKQFSAFFGFFQRSLLRQSFSVATGNWVTTEFLCCNIKLGHDRVFSVATVFFVQLVGAIPSSFQL